MKFTCKYCEQRLEIENENMGKVVECPNCYNELKVPTHKETNSVRPMVSSCAIFSIVFSLYGIVVFPCIIVSIICGHMARKEIYTQPEHFKGEGIALVGLIISYTILIPYVVSIVICILMMAGCTLLVGAATSQ